MSNLGGGGRIVIGVDMDNSGGHILAGMDKGASRTFREDEVLEFVNKYADPPVQMHVQQVSQGERHLVVIDIPEFNHHLILCKGDLDREGKKHLESGRLYYRPKGGAKSTSRLTHQDLRGLLDLAVIKRHSYWTRQLRKLGAGEPSHSDIFDKEASDF